MGSSGSGGGGGGICGLSSDLISRETSEERGETLSS